MEFLIFNYSEPDCDFLFCFNSQLFYRNLIEYRVRQAHHVYVKEKDLMKYMCTIEAFSISGLLAWTVTSVQGGNSNQRNSSADGLFVTRSRVGEEEFSVCNVYWWSYFWHICK